MPREMFPNSPVRLIAAVSRRLQCYSTSLPMQDCRIGHLWPKHAIQKPPSRIMSFSISEPTGTPFGDEKKSVKDLISYIYAYLLHPNAFRVFVKRRMPARSL